MTTQLEEAVVELITETDELTHEVISKMQMIEQRVSDAETELDTHWIEKSTVINNEWISKKAEIDAKLSTFDNRIIYVAPTAQNAGTGVDADNATTLAEALSSHIIPSVANTIKLGAGLHILPTQELKDIFLINFEPAGVYDSNNPPIICTPNTIDSTISTDATGITSDSQICDAHGYDETPLIFKNATVQFNNVWLRGTRHCLKFDKSTVFTLGDVNLDLWVYSASCTSHSGTALHATDSQIYSDATLSINLWHPDYTACSDVLANHAAPIFLDNSKQIQKGKLIWSSNIKPDAYPKQMSIGWRTPFEATHATALNIVNGSHLHIERLKINNVMQLFWADDSKFSVAFMEMDQLSEPLQYLGQLRGQNAQASFTNRNAEWYDSAEPNHVRMANVSDNPEQASLIAYDGAKVYLDGINLTANEASGSFISSEMAEILLQNNVINALDRDNGQGFMQISHNTNGKVICKNNQLSTRLGDNDTGFVTLEGGFTKVKDNQLACGQEYQVDTYGRHQDSLGNTQGMFSFAEDKTFTVPGDYPDLTTAIAAISNLVIAPSAHITLDLAEGEHVLTQDLVIYNMENLTIKGGESLEKNLVSFVSATGSAGDWEVTLQLNDVSDVEVGDFLLVQDITGTGIPEVHLGGWEIIAKSGTNVTVKHYCPETAFPTNTLTGGTAYVLKTILNFSGSYAIKASMNQRLEFNAIVCKSLIASNISKSGIGLYRTIFNAIPNTSSVCLFGSSTVNFQTAAASGSNVISLFRFIYCSISVVTELFVNSGDGRGLQLEHSNLSTISSTGGKIFSLYNNFGIYGFQSGIELKNGSLNEHYILHNNIDYYATDGSLFSILKYSGTPIFSPAINTIGNKHSYIAG
ncbi:hypothetical protein [Candidatus Albibeggiatoa sp. nov. BB20]|uniref:hypothetical protein n=1 Tax=Candidatus Albibeggiatoa sp. nov. BB20 TaxID=3162723 RepID=UPI003365A9E1